MSVGLIKSGGYVPCGASATLMSQYPMKPTSDIIALTTTQLYNGWTAPCAGEFVGTVYINESYLVVNGVTIFYCYTSHGVGVTKQASIILNKGDIVAYTGAVDTNDWVHTFRPFAVGEVL